MERIRPLTTAWRAALLALALAVPVVVVSATQLYVNWSRYAEVSFVEILAAKAVDWLPWVPMAALVVAVERRRGFAARAWPRALALHLAIAVAWFGAHNAMMVSVGRGFGHLPRAFAVEYLDRIFFKLPGALLVYAFVLVAFWIGHLVDTRHREEVRRLKLEGELADARLRNLKMQLHPHFLFNTMNTIAALVREGERTRAVEVMSELADLLRRALQDGELQEVPLEDEVDFLRRYLRIQHLRFGDRLRADVRVEDGVRRAAVPSLLLQPIVENAIRHGLDLSAETGQVRVTAGHADGRLVLEVTDNGHGMPDGGETEGMGLGTTRRRLAHLYGDAQRLEIGPAAPRGTRVRIELPLRLLAPARAPGRPLPAAAVPHG